MGLHVRRHFPVMAARSTRPLACSPFKMDKIRLHLHFLLPSIQLLHTPKKKFKKIVGNLFRVRYAGVNVNMLYSLGWPGSYFRKYLKQRIKKPVKVRGESWWENLGSVG